MSSVESPAPTPELTPEQQQQAQLQQMIATLRGQYIAQQSQVFDATVNSLMQALGTLQPPANRQERRRRERDLEKARAKAAREFKSKNP